MTRRPHPDDVLTELTRLGEERRAAIQAQRDCAARAGLVAVAADGVVPVAVMARALGVTRPALIHMMKGLTQDR